MKQFILPYPPDHTGMIRLSGKDFHYLAHVRRFKPGMAFTARLPTGEIIAVQVQSVGRDCLIGACGGLPAETPAQSVAESAQGAETPVQALPRLLLFQALPKAPKMDVIIRQAAELGIAEVVPFIGAYSAVPAGADKTARWNRIIREARQQSGSPVATAVGEPCTVDRLLSRWEELKARHPRAAGVILHQEPLVQESFHRYLSPMPEVVALAVGPEGGFAPAELNRFRAAGFKPLALGTPILRTETAALAAAAAVRIILLESESWMLKIP